MIKALAARGFIDREPGTARSIRLHRRERSCRISSDPTVKPPSWAVDVRHYIDEGTGDLP